MDFATIKQSVSLRDFAEAHLEPSGRTFVCPCCASGNGPNHTSAFLINENQNKPDSWHCFSCNEGGSVLDLAKAYLQTDSLVEAGNYLTEWARLDNLPVTTSRHFVRAPEPEPDYTEARNFEKEYIQQYHQYKYLEQIKPYLASRGFTVDEAYKLGFGYDAGASGGKTAEGEWCKRGRLIIPWPGSDYYHIDRSVDPRAKERKYIKPASKDVGKQPIFNPDALSSHSVFLCEGALDALSIMACGQQAIALGGTAHYDISNYLRSKHYAGSVIIMLDNDSAGKAASDKIYDLLTEPTDSKGSQVEAYTFEWGQPDIQQFNDPAELFVASRQLLSQKLSETTQIAKQVRHYTPELEQDIQVDRSLESSITFATTEKTDEVKTSERNDTGAR